jgi:hypothetical protein
MVFDGVAFTFCVGSTNVDHAFQQVVDVLLIPWKVCREDGQSKTSVYLEEKVVHVRELRLRCPAEEACCPDEYLHMPRDGNVPAPINPAALSYEMSDPVLEQFHGIAAM